MMHEAKKYLVDILLAIKLIEKFSADLTDYNNFLEDLKTQSAIERQLAIIGEAVNKFGRFDTQPPLEHAKQIVGFRNRLIHAYDSVDPSIVWAILNKFLAPLKKEVETRLLDI